MTGRFCLLCGQPATTTMPAGPVCQTHAEEFYRGLVAFAINRDREIVEWVPVDEKPKRRYVKKHPRWFKSEIDTAA